MSIVDRTFTVREDLIKVLHDSDFTIDSPISIGLNYSGCISILFYIPNEEAEELITVWIETAKNVPGVIFCTCNLTEERKIAKAFTNITITVLRWAQFIGTPYLMTYREGMPVSVYNGERSVQPMTDFYSTLACNPDYYEPQIIAGGTTVDRNLGMGGWKQFESRKSSVDFTTGNPVRDFRKGVGIFRVTNQPNEGQQAVTEPASGDTLAGRINKTRVKEGVETIEGEQQEEVAAQPPVASSPTVGEGDQRERIPV